MIRLRRFLIFEADRTFWPGRGARLSSLKMSDAIQNAPAPSSILSPTPQSSPSPDSSPDSSPDPSPDPSPDLRLPKKVTQRTLRQYEPQRLQFRRLHARSSWRRRDGRTTVRPCTRRRISSRRTRSFLEVGLPRGLIKRCLRLSSRGTE